MTTTREGSHIIITCDECGEIFESDEQGAFDAYQEAKDEGWRAFKNNKGDWEHACPDCVIDFARKG
jgi:Fe2+ or Zn2+ uptake regulation protein